MNARSRHLLASGATALALAAASAGCDTTPPGGGFTNPNPGSAVERDKPAERTDLPVPDPDAGRPGTAAESARSSPATPGTNAGTGGPGGGQVGNDKGSVRQAAPEAASSPPASPPKKENAGNAQGGTKPDDSIKVGNPRSPQ
jgi:hypothetical protein